MPVWPGLCSARKAKRCVNRHLLMNTHEIGASCDAIGDVAGPAAVALLLVRAFGRGGAADHAQRFNGVSLTVTGSSDGVSSLDPSVQVALIGTWTIAFGDSGGYAV